jgi:hypothetical protein
VHPEGVVKVLISALDENGKAVDWWFAYKVPEMSGKGPAAATGYEYLYYDPGVGKVATSPFQLTVARAPRRHARLGFQQPAGHDGLDPLQRRDARRREEE